jgi:hypothetical protein
MMTVLTGDYDLAYIPQKFWSVFVIESFMTMGWSEEEAIGAAVQFNFASLNPCFL